MRTEFNNAARNSRSHNRAISTERGKKNRAGFNQTDAVVSHRVTIIPYLATTLPLFATTVRFLPRARVAVSRFRSG